MCIFLCLCVKDLCKVYEMKTNNLLAKVEYFSICRKETQFQQEFQQYE